MEDIVIGVEELVGSGKTSICRELLNYISNSIFYHVLKWNLFLVSVNLSRQKITYIKIILKKCT